MKFWQNLSERERIILGVGVPLFFVILGYFYYWLPNSEKLLRLRQEVPQKTAELAWMKHELEQSASWLVGETANLQSSPILTVIEKRAIETGVKPALQRVQPGQNQDVKLWFQEVVADQWIQFVSALAYDGISASQATITRTTDGKVNVRVTFVR